jgi:hypothetical protein
MVRKEAPAFRHGEDVTTIGILLRAAREQP